MEVPTAPARGLDGERGTRALADRAAKGSPPRPGRKYPHAPCPLRPARPRARRGGRARGRPARVRPGHDLPGDVPRAPRRPDRRPVAPGRALPDHRRGHHVRPSVASVHGVPRGLRRPAAQAVALHGRRRRPAARSPAAAPSRSSGRPTTSRPCTATRPRAAARTATSSARARSPSSTTTASASCGSPRATTRSRCSAGTSPARPRSASSAVFLERPSGKLPRNWVVLPRLAEFMKYSSHHGFRIKPAL